MQVLELRLLLRSSRPTTIILSERCPLEVETHDLEGLNNSA